MPEDLEAMREENWLLREAMENQSRVQEDVLSRFLDELGAHDSTSSTPVVEQPSDTAQQSARQEGIAFGCQSL